MINKKLNINKAFTLIEIIVAITIFSIMMTSVIFIFVNSSQLSLKIDINRTLQENSKNIIETIAEDLRKNDIKECAWSISEWCVSSTLKFSTWTELWVWDNHYYLAKKDSLWNLIKTTNLYDCDELKKQEQCFIAVKKWLEDPAMLSNSSVKIENLEFSIFSEHIPKVQINLFMRPMIWKWVKVDLIKNNELNIQTTLSERYLKQ